VAEEGSAGVGRARGDPTGTEPALDASRLVACASAPALATTLQGTIIEWNRHAARLLGFPASDAIGRSFFDLLAPTDYFGNHYRTDGGALAEQILAGEAVHAFELDLRTRSQSVVSVTVSVVFLLASERSRWRAIYFLCPGGHWHGTNGDRDRDLGTEGTDPTPGRRAADPPQLLSARQRQVLRLLVEGLSAPTIAADLGISVHTVRNHVQAIYHRLGVRTRAAAVYKVVSAHLV